MIPLFKKASDPSIVNITSLGALFLNRSVCEFSYAQSKAAGMSFSRDRYWEMGLGLMDRGTSYQIDVGRFDAFQDPSQCDLSRSVTRTPYLISLESSTNTIYIGLFHSNLTTDSNGNLWQPMQEAVNNIPKG